MSRPDWTPSDEMYDLVNKYCENLLNDAEATKLSSLLRSDWRVRAFLVEYVQLHAQLAWEGAALQAVDYPPNSDENGLESRLNELQLADSSKEVTGRVRVSARSAQRQDPAPPARRRWIQTGFAVACAAGILLIMNAFRETPTGPAVVDNADGGASSTEVANVDGSVNGSGEGNIETPPEPIRLEGLEANRKPNESVASTAEAEMAVVENPENVGAGELPVVEVPETDDEIIAQIDEYLRRSINESVAPAAAAANDQEWVRRVYLTFTGRIPSVAEHRQFMSFPAGRRRSVMIDVLSADERTAENLSVNWLNLLIGRSNPRQVNEDSLFTFLSEQFRGNRPWIETVGKLIAAEGRSDENGATNFLLAHLNDQAAPATAVTARLFLGEQVHCTQCHNHPFAKELTQDQFWELNAFFKQAERRQVLQPDGQPMPGGVFELVDHEKGGMTFYETRRGQQVAVLPEFAGVKLPKDDGVHRRDELAKLLEQDPEHRVARSMVNRMWQHFFGFGFTMPVDDMGPHNPVSHPELLDFLSRAFVKSGYDVKRLMYWIASTDAWQRSSAPVEGSDDVPEAGELPLFTRVYARHLDPEEVYDSIRVAIRSVSGQPLTSSIGTQHRRDWVRQFVESYGTDENDESLGFEGNVSQALIMMNGQDLEEAIPMAIRTMLRSYEGRTPSPNETLEQICLATVSRQPTDDEVKAFRHRIRTLNGEVPDQDVLRIALEDMFWAYLNSTEFSLNH